MPDEVKWKVVIAGYALLIVGLLGAFSNTFIGVLGLFVPPQPGTGWQFNVVMAGTMLLCAAASAFVAPAGYNMFHLKRYRLVMTGSVVAAVGMCFFSLVGLPLGIWATVILLNPKVRAAFRSLE